MTLPPHASAEFHLSAGEATATVAARGAELTRWAAGGRELLWDGDPAFWAERSPILFPVVGWTRGGVARIGGRTYPLGLHGFARRKAFRLQDHGAAHVSLVLEEDADTLAHYPVPFRLVVTWRLAPASIRVELRVENTGSGPMPFAIGVHPGFRTPAGSEGCAVLFEREENPLVPLIAPGGLIGTTHRRVPVEGTRLALGGDLFASDALVFVGARSRWVDLVDPGGSKLRVAFENMPNIVLWSRPGAGFLCIEGWSGLGDPEGFEGDLFEKPGMIVLAPGEASTHALAASVDA
jgi:galactose mutarotase-like enzyme